MGRIICSASSSTIIPPHPRNQHHPPPTFSTITMTVKISEQKTGSEGTTKHAPNENSKMPLLVSGVARRKRGPAGRETTHPIAVSFQRSTPQAVQSTILNGQSTQIASQK